MPFTFPLKGEPFLVVFPTRIEAALQPLCFQSIQGPARLGTPKEQKEDKGTRAEGAELEGADGAQ